MQSLFKRYRFKLILQLVQLFNKISQVEHLDIHYEQLDPLIYVVGIGYPHIKF
jgi:hypothetical protein